MDDDVLLYGMAAAPFIGALIQVAKPLGLPKRLWPLAAIVLGVGWQLFLTVGTEDFSRATVLLGVVVGLSAAGLYSTVRAVRGAVDGQPE